MHYHLQYKITEEGKCNMYPNYVCVSSLKEVVDLNFVSIFLSTSFSVKKNKFDWMGGRGLNPNKKILDTTNYITQNIWAIQENNEHFLQTIKY